LTEGEGFCKTENTCVLVNFNRKKTLGRNMIVLSIQDRVGWKKRVRGYGREVLKGDSRKYQEVQEWKEKRKRKEGPAQYFQAHIERHNRSDEVLAGRGLAGVRGSEVQGRKGEEIRGI